MSQLLYQNRNKHWKKAIFVIDLMLHIVLASVFVVYRTANWLLIIPTVIWFLALWAFFYKKHFRLFKIYGDRIEVGGGIFNKKVEVYKYETFKKCVYDDSFKKRRSLFGGINFNYLELYCDDSINSKYVKNGRLRLNFTEYADRYNKIYKVLKVFKNAEIELLVNSNKEKIKTLIE